jgi:hypothetical protein
VKTDRNLIPQAGDREAICDELEACGVTDYRRISDWSSSGKQIEFTCLECRTPWKASMSVATTQWFCFACLAKGNLRTLRSPEVRGRPKPTRALGSRGSFSAISDQVAFALMMIERHASTTEIVRDLMRVKGSPELPPSGESRLRKGRHPGAGQSALRIECGGGGSPGECLGGQLRGTPTPQRYRG